MKNSVEKEAIIAAVLDAIYMVSAMDKKPELSHKIEDFELYSLDVVEVVMHVENTFGFKIEDDKFDYDSVNDRKKELSVAQVCDLFIEAINGKENE